MSATETRPQLLTVEQVARRLQQSPRTIRRKIAAGLIPAIRLNADLGPLRVQAEELDELLERRRVQPSEEAP